MFSSCNLSLSGIPNNANLLPGTTKELPQYLMPLLIMVSLQTPICDTHELYVQYYFLSIELFRYVIFAFGYSTLNILMGITLPSLLVSIVHSHSSVLSLVLF